jgi:hypothetical protein
MKTSTKKWIQAILIALCILALGFAGCSVTHSTPYTIKTNAASNVYSLMDKKRTVATFTDERLDSIILNDNK